MTLIGGRYRLVSPIAKGGMGTVWEGWDERLQRRVAIKQLHPQPGLPPADAQVAGERVLREARNAARLHHPHAVPVYDVVEDDGNPCLIMQYLPSQSLQQILATRGPLDPASVARIGSEVGSALEAAHQVGIVHRDVKPGNVLIDADGAAKLTDFGISHASGDASLTSTGMVTGTPAYLAPEVARGAVATPASDVFSLGSTLYTALEGVSPFGDGQNAMATLHRAASGQIEPPHRSGPLTPVLQRMLAVDPAQRPSMAEVTEMLRRIRSGAADPAAFAATQRFTPPPPASPPPPSSTVVLPPVGPPGGRPPQRAVLPPPGPPPERRSLVPLLVGLLIVAAIVGGLIALLVHGLGDSGTPSGGSTGSSQPKTSPSHRASHSSSPARHSSSPATHSASNPPSTTPPTQASNPPSTNPPSKPTPPAKGGGGGPGSSDPATAITNYYSLLPGNTDAAWNLLTKKFQNGTAGGRQTYDQYWGSMQSVSASNATDTGPNSAQAVIHYVYKSGRTVDELTSFDFKNQGGTLKIDGQH